MDITIDMLKAGLFGIFVMGYIVGAAVGWYFYKTHEPMEPDEISDEPVLNSPFSHPVASTSPRSFTRDSSSYSRNRKNDTNRSLTADINIVKLP